MYMRILETERDGMDQVLAALNREIPSPDIEIQDTVRRIIADVRQRGDEALIDYGRRFDSPHLDGITVTEPDFEDAYSQVSPELLDAIRVAKSNIEAFHRKQLRNSWIDMRDGLAYGQLVRPIRRVGFYAPAGLAPYPSTVLMTAVPGLVAGVEEMVMCAPAERDTGKIRAAMIVAARECGVNKIFKIGGAQAAAAMAYGTKSVPRVDKIVGPGNAWVTEAKRQLFGIVGIDQLAGPSEILIIADDTANPAYVAADILSQAEHASDSQCVMVTPSRTLADAVIKEVRAQTESAIRKEYIEDSLRDLGVMVITRGLDECIDLANAFAPEHLEIQTSDPWELLKRIKNAGAIMVGHYTPVPLCDFAAGPNHTLPTGGTARFSSGLTVDDYIKMSSYVSVDKDALRRIGSTVVRIADCEGFDAHANTVRLRLENQV